MADEKVLATFLRKLEVRDALSEAEKAALVACASEEVEFPAGSDIVREGDRPTSSMMVLDGFSSRYSDSPDGARQITAIHVPGDFVDLHSLLLREMDHSVGALSACRVMRFPHGRLRDLTETHPHLTRLLWMQTLIDGAIHREWIVAMGRRSRKSHIAHLICELFVRLRVVKKTDGWSFFFPLTQAATADALGISLVHLNKTLQKLRKEDLFRWENRTIVIEDWEGLQQVAEFDSSYLNLSVEPR